MHSIHLSNLDTDMQCLYAFLMRRSPLRSTLAVLRQELGLTQEQMGKLIDPTLSRPTIQAIELGPLRLTEENAAKFSAATGISARWLLEGKPRKRMVTPEGEKYTKEIFETHQALLEMHQALLKVNRGDLADGLAAAKPALGRFINVEGLPDVLYMRGTLSFSDWFGVYSAAEKAGKLEIMEYLMRRFIDEMRDRFGFDGEAAQKLDGEIRFKSGVTFQVPRGFAETFKEGTVHLLRKPPWPPSPENVRPGGARKSS